MNRLCERLNILMLLATASALVACGGPDLSRCEGVPAASMDAIQRGLDGGRLVDARAVQSRDYEDAWFISATVQGPDAGAPDAIATWASIHDREAVVSVNDAAVKYSDLAPAITMSTNPQLSMYRDGAELSQDCVSERAR